MLWWTLKVPLAFGSGPASSHGVRRPVLLALAAVVSMCCAEGVSRSEAHSPSPLAWPGAAPGDTMVQEPLSYREQAVGGGQLGDRLPMLIALHGKLGSPEDISGAFAGVHTPARLIAPRGAPFGSGFVWWDLALKNADPRPFSAAAAEASRRMAAFVRQLVHDKPTLGQPVFVGFSQGAIVAYSIAVREPGLTRSVFPLSGNLPLGLEPSAWPPGAPKPVVHAFHGGEDPWVPLAFDRDSVARLQALGVPATLTELPSMPHILGPVEMAMVIPEIDAALRREAAAPPSP